MANHLSQNLPLETVAKINKEPAYKQTLVRNWFLHNVVSHPASEAAYWVIRPISKAAAEKISGAIHDCTVPSHKPGTGRG